MSIKDFTAFTINHANTIREAFKKEGLTKEKFVIVTDDEANTIGIVTDGDFRRAIWNSVSLEEKIGTIVNRNFKYLSGRYDLDDVARMFLTGIAQVPVLKDGKLVDIIFRRDVEHLEAKFHKNRLNAPVVIMAGGLGTRLDPFTRILPKPLIPIGEKPIIEIIMDKFAEYGMTEFHISINHMAKMIKAFFEDFGVKYKISYIEEEEPLGTAGALALLKEEIMSPFFLSNCDIIIEDDYSQIYDFHTQGGYALTIVGSVQHHVIPYGVCTVKESGELDELKEKPAHDFVANTGMYVLSPRIFDFIPAGTKFHITDLINALKRGEEKVGVYPVCEKAWIDVGQWEKYRKAIDARTI